MRANTRQLCKYSARTCGPVVRIAGSTSSGIPLLGGDNAAEDGAGPMGGGGGAVQVSSGPQALRRGQEVGWVQPDGGELSEGVGGTFGRLTRGGWGSFRAFETGPQDGRGYAAIFIDMTVLVRDCTAHTNTRPIAGIPVKRDEDSCRAPRSSHMSSMQGAEWEADLGHLEVGPASVDANGMHTWQRQRSAHHETCAPSSPFAR